jgi:hypothetical protein
MHFPPVRASGYPTPAYDPYENRSTTRQVNRQQTNFSLFNVNIMHFFFLHPIKNNLRDKHELIAIHEPPRNTSEGGEFLDDAIRMEDLSLARTEESVAAGSPENLL